MSKDHRFLLSVMLLIAIIIEPGVCLFAQLMPPDSMYLGQSPPAGSAIQFGKRIIGDDFLHGRIVFSSDGREVFWTTIDTSTFSSQIKHAVFINGRWSSAAVPSFAVSGITGNPVFSPDGQKLFFNYRTTIASAWEIRYVTKLNDTLWSDLRNDGFMLFPSASFTVNGKVYYSDYKKNKPWQTAIYSANYSGTGFSGVQLLDQVINSAFIDYTPYIASDESFLLFSSSRPVQNENMHIFISFRRNSAWTTPQNINEAIGYNGNARFPVISDDGKYLFFCGDDGDMYWVDLNSVLRLNEVIYDKQESVKDKCSLYQNYPNPFNPSTSISYSITRSEFVKIRFYNSLGMEVSTPIASCKQAGEHTLVFNSHNLPNGVYFYQLSVGSYSVTRKMIVLK